MDYCEKHEIAFIPWFKLGGRLAGEVLNEIPIWRPNSFCCGAAGRLQAVLQRHSDRYEVDLVVSRQ